MFRSIYVAIPIALLGNVLCAHAQISIPYFKKLTAQEVCGGFNRYCQPISSLKFDRVKGLDFRRLSDWLSTTYTNTAFERERCDITATPADFEQPVTNAFTASYEKKYEGKLRAILEVDVLQYLSSLNVPVPEQLKARLAADATDQLIAGDGGKASFTYSRHDLSMDSIPRLMEKCPPSFANRKFVTGVSVVNMSGDWARSRIVDSFGKFEASVDFIGLTPDIKSNYTDLKKRASAGTFKELSFVIATSWRKIPKK